MIRTMVGVAAGLALLSAGPIHAQDDEDTGPFKDFDELVEGTESAEGLFDTYVKGENLYLAIPEDMMNEPFLMETKIARGIGTSGVFGGTMLDIFEGRLVAFERHGDKIYFVKRQHRFHGENDESAARAVDLSFGSSILQSADIESIRDDGATVIDVHNWMVSDLSNISQRMTGAASAARGSQNRVSFDRSRSYLESVDTYPRNVNIQAKLTFSPQQPININSVPDSRYLPVSIHYTMAALPDTPMTPWIDDDRTGFFPTVHKDYSQEDSTFFVRYANRWRLERGRRVGDLWEPREPITYYIENTVPEAYREYLKRGVEVWNDAFEAAGWRNAIQARDLPDDADADDIRYATLRWNTSDQSGYGAIGPSVVDPRTGEILDADILFEASMIGNFRNTWRNVLNPANPAEVFEQALGIGWDEREIRTGSELSSFASTLAAQGALIQAYLADRGEIGPSDPIPEEYLGEVLVWVTAHEVGHTLGLQHNFRASSDTPFERLHDREFTGPNGIYNSVMEYPSPNIAPPGQPVGHIYNPSVGSYDKWVISVGYNVDPERGRELARMGAQDGHLFASSFEAGGPGALDPTVNAFDMSDDPLAWGEQRSTIIRNLWERVPEIVLEDNVPYSAVTTTFQQLLGQYASALAPTVKYLGGQYVNRDHHGDPDARSPFVNVPRAEQVRALNLLIDRALSEGAFDIPQNVLRQFGANRWSHWGNNNTFNGRTDYPLHEQVLNLQRSMLGQLMHPFRLARIRDAETKFGQSEVVTIPELMGTVSGAIWSELTSASNISSNRRDLQRAHLEGMGQILESTSTRMPADAKSVARVQLRRLGDRIDTALAQGNFDAYTEAHLVESRERITKVLDASFN